MERSPLPASFFKMLELVVVRISALDYALAL